MAKKTSWSRTNWEESYFGNTDMLLWDLPHITLSYSFDILPAKREDIKLYPYDQKKLLALFLLRVKELGLTNRLFQSIDFSIVEKKGYKLVGDTQKYAKWVFDRDTVKNVLNNVISVEVDYKAIFLKYSNFLVNAEISYTKLVPEDKSADELKKDLNDDLNNVQMRFRNYYLSGFVGEGNTFADLKKKTTFTTISGTGGKINYTKEEIEESEKLVNLLDISFDKDVSKITNLKTGKIDLHKIPEIIAGVDRVYYRKELQERTKPFNVCILNDESGSMNSQDRINIQHKVTKMLYRTFSQILDPTEIYVYGHTGGSTPEIYVYNDKFNPTFEENFKNQLSHSFRQNYDGVVIDKIYEKIRGFTEKNILFIVISDGQPNGDNYGGFKDREDMKRIIERCKRDGFVTCGVGFHYSGVKKLYNYNAVINDLDDAVPAISRLINNVVRTEFQ